MLNTIIIDDCLNMQMCLNVSNVKFMPASDIICFGSKNFGSTILAALIRTSAARLSAFFTIGNLL